MGIFFIFAIFVLPQRKLPEEKGIKLLHEERCSGYWKSLGGALVAGGNIPIARISFYEDFFVISLLGIAKVNYSDIVSSSFKNKWFSKSIMINLANGRGLVINAKNVEKIKSIITTKNPKAV